MSEQSEILQDGLRILSDNQTITFKRYVRKILPLDGFVFWINAREYSSSEPTQITVEGSLHVSINQEMREDENIAVSQVVFTTQTEIERFTDIDSSTLWLGCFNGTRFSFTRRGKYYRNAKTYHYTGDAIYPAFESQIVEKLSSLDSSAVVVSDSMPLWLQLVSIPLYPSYLVPTNLKPPYGSIHIDKTESLQAAFSVDKITGDLDNSAKDEVRIVLYGANNNKAFDFLNEVDNYCLFTENFGLMNSPTIQDEKRAQSDINAIAQKKTIAFTVNYRQSRLNLLARRMLDAAFIDVYTNEFLSSSQLLDDTVSSDIAFDNSISLTQVTDNLTQ
jgi:hypothetical protein